MALRGGVSLVEVLVSLVLLAVGVAGAVAALQAAARVRVRAATLEVVASAVEARLAWFESDGCVERDTLIAVDGRVRETWSVTRDSAGARLRGRAARDVGSQRVPIALEVRRSCP